MRISKRVPISVIVAAIAALSTALVFGALSALGMTTANTARDTAGS